MKKFYDSNTDGEYDSESNIKNETKFALLCMARERNYETVYEYFIDILEGKDEEISKTLFDKPKNRNEFSTEEESQ